MEFSRSFSIPLAPLLTQFGIVNMTVEDAAWKTEHSTWDPRTSHAHHFLRAASYVAVLCDTLEFPCTGVSVRDLPNPWVQECY